MRISDWSSDVCSSDLKSASAPLPPTSSNLKVKPPAMPSSAIAGGLRAKTMASLIDVKKPIAFPTKASELFSSPERSSHGLSIVNIIDRKSAVTGKSVSVRVVLGGRSHIKKEQNNNTQLS